MNCNTKLNKHWNTPPVLCRSLILVALAAITPGWAAATEAGEATVAYQAKGDLLTIQANNVSLRKVLAQISGSTREIRDTQHFQVLALGCQSFGGCPVDVRK